MKHHREKLAHKCHRKEKLNIHIPIFLSAKYIVSLSSIAGNVSTSLMSIVAPRYET